MKTLLRSLLVLLLTLCLVLTSTVGCTVTIHATELSVDYAPSARREGEVTAAFIAAMADFSLTLTNATVAREQEGKANHLVSPLSAMICLSMLANGAEGNTLAQMEAVLGMKIDDLNRALYAYTSGLYVGDDCRVSLADSIWYRDGGGFSVREEFLQTCADWYEAQQYAAPFDETTREDINSWVKKYTDGAIDTMLDTPIPADTVMYVINALVFDAKWQVAYERKQISDHTFTARDGSQTTVDMMNSEEGVYLTVAGGQGFAKPYKGGHYSFVGLLPDEGVDIYEFAASLDGGDWVAMWDERYLAATVKARIPEFGYDSSMALKPILAQMGMNLLFDQSLCDLSGIGSAASGSLYCDGVYQKTYIEVNRNGTKAAAITWADNREKAAAPDETVCIYLDRPFVYAIVDNRTGLPLFLGVVTALG